MASKSALVFGATGVTGWSFVNEILNDYPKKGIWKRVHALANRPLKQESSLWPNDPRLNIVTGVDLLAGTQEELEKKLLSNISKDELAEVTHVYYLGEYSRKCRTNGLTSASIQSGDQSRQGT
jgi:hypothetical protein